MSNYEEVEEIMCKRFGKDTLIAVATTDGSKMYNRIVDAYYEDGKFYFTSTTSSNKVKQLEKHPEVAIASVDWFSGHATAKNLGWVSDPDNSQARDKVKKAFEWYVSVVDEKNEDNCIIELTLTEGMLIKDHMETRYKVDFANKQAKVSKNFGEFE